MENMVKAYIISNRDKLREYKIILDSNIYYSLESTFKLYKIVVDIVDINIRLKNKKITGEKMELNKKLVSLNKELEVLLDGRN